MTSIPLPHGRVEAIHKGTSLLNALGAHSDNQIYDANGDEPTVTVRGKSYRRDPVLCRPFLDRH